MPNPTTPIYSITEMVQAQAQPHVIFNEAIRRLEVIAGKVAGGFEAAPPGSPDEGDVVIVDDSATGAFEGREDEVAYFSGGAWLFIDAQEGEIWAIGAGWYRFAGSAGWVEVEITDAP